MTIRIQKLDRIRPFYFINNFLADRKIISVKVTDVAEIEVAVMDYDNEMFEYLKSVIQSKGYELDGKFLLAEYKSNKYVRSVGEIHFDIGSEWFGCIPNSKRLCDIANRPLGWLFWLFKNV